MSDDTSDLIHRMLRGDESSFSDIIAAYAGDVLRMGYMLLGDSEEARDVLQESLFALVRQVRLGRFRSSNGSIKGFLMTVARNLCLKRLRKKVRFHSLSDETENFEPALRDTHTPVRAAQDAQFETAFDDALGQMSGARRTVFVLHELNGESYEQIANALRLSVEAVRMHMSRARTQLRQLLAAHLGET